MKTMETTTVPTIDPGMLGHRIASEVVRRERFGLGAHDGRDSLYNLIREVAIDVLAEEATDAV